MAREASPSDVRDDAGALVALRAAAPPVERRNAWAARFRRLAPS
jgi:hypothetical protein